jgi:alpha-ketoglutarate-dependent 2,4-dichlorophenoxyacetate dioxygenase
MAVTVEPLTPHFGARLTGFSIRDGLSDDDFTAIDLAANTYGLVVMPCQKLDDETQVSFSERLGPLEETLVGAVGAGSKIVRVTNILADGTLKDPDSQLALFTRANFMWHTDSSFKAHPAKFSMLSARELPNNGGGDTEFASTAAAFDMLPEETQARLEGLIAIHSIAWSREKFQKGASSEEQRKRLPPVPQALVRKNPVTGRKSLHIASHVMGIDGMEEREGLALHNDLLALSTHPSKVWRHQWSPDDAIIWDNRAIVHRATPYDETRDRRLMIRTTISDFGPTVVDGAIVAAA